MAQHGLQLLVCGNEGVEATHVRMQACQLLLQLLDILRSILLPADHEPADIEGWSSPRQHVLKSQIEGLGKQSTHSWEL